MIKFNVPPVVGTEIDTISSIISAKEKMSGDGSYSKKCEKWLKEQTGSKKVLMTPSCTSALEMSAILIGIQPGDEVIMPSYTFVSTANAFVLRGAKVIFVDIKKETLNIDEKLIEAAITDKTKAIVVVHYAGVSCEMNQIMKIADKNNLFVIEDAAQGVKSSYSDKPLGSIGHLGAFSFHDTKNYTSAGEGGALLINDDRFLERAEIIREKGTNRSQFFRGMVDKYTWVDIGSSVLPTEIQSAYLYCQLEQSDKINDFRLALWNKYYKGLKDLNNVSLPTIPQECTHNAHMFYLIVESLEVRTKLIQFLKENDIIASFHYVPLHSSPAGKKHSEFNGDDNYTTNLSNRLVRLPMWYGLGDESVERVISKVREFYNE